MSRWLEEHAVGRTIASAEAGGRWAGVDLSPVSSRTVTAIGRWGKLHWLELDGDPPLRLVAQMGMSGRWSADAVKHPMLVLRLGSGETLSIDDPRRFGRIAVASPADVAVLVDRCKTSVVHDAAFAARFAARAVRDRRAICAVLLDQRIAAGVGNYIKCEAMYAARVHPEAPANSLGLDRLEDVGRCARATALASLDAGGATFMTHRTPDGHRTAAASAFAVYGRRECPACHPIQRTPSSDGRTTHWCPAEQGAPTVSS